VIVTADKRALLTQLAERRPQYFPGTWSVGRLGAFKRDGAPVAAWQIEGMRWAEGRSASQNAASNILGGSPKLTEPASRLKPLGRGDFAAGVVVIQAEAIAGLTTTQIADYAAMRALVRTDPGKLRTGGPATILTAIDAPMGTAVPLTLTKSDLRFLKAFYASGNTSYAEHQRSQMRQLIQRDMEREASEPNDRKRAKN
jgi:hypothetical protein